MTTCDRGEVYAYTEYTPLTNKSFDHVTKFVK